VSQYVESHPEAMYQEIKNIKSNDKANLEIDLGEIADDKFVLEVQSPPTNLVQKAKKSETANVDTSIPKWPIYSKPLT
jgi:hypothetical protein